MEELSRILSLVERFTEPVIQPTLGVRIYAPEVTDLSAQAKFKRQVMQVAAFEVQRARAILAGISPPSRRFQSQLLAQIDIELSGDSELLEFSQYAITVEHLAGLTDTAT